MLEKLFKDKREVYRIHASHTLRSIALSVIGIYVPIYLLTIGYSLSEVILYYVVFHVAGLFWALLVLSRFSQRYGLIRTLKLYYPLEILHLLLLYLLATFTMPYLAIAVVGGVALFTYYIPLNILLLRHAKFDKMGSDLANFFALPKIFSIAGPIIGALLIPFLGFWSVFAMSSVGLVFSYMPLARIRRSSISVHLNFVRALKQLKQRKLVFLMEGFDNIIEESEWFWGIYIFLVIGTLSSAGIVGALSALGGALFTFLIGKRLNKGMQKPIFIASFSLFGIYIVRMFVDDALSAYFVTLVASFAMTLFLVSYFGMIYRTVKGKDEVEFIFLREIPTVLGRLIIFGAILLLVNSLEYFFFVPMVAVMCMVVILFIKRRSLAN